MTSFLLVVPLLAQQNVNSYTVEKERAIGQQYAIEIRRQSQPFESPATDAYVKRIGGELVAQLKNTPFDYQFEVISGGTWTEPFSLPGGYVFIPARALVAAQDEAEFVGMLAHSIGHVVLRHGTRTATLGQTANITSIPLVFMGGWHANSEQPQILVPAALLDAVRTNELEADRFGLELASRTGYAATAYLRYVERTQWADSKLSPWPAREVRLTRLREITSSLPAPTLSSSGEEFRRAQEEVLSIVKRPEKQRTPTLRR